MKKLQLFLVLHLIGWEGGASFLDQSHGKIKENQSNPDYFRHPIENDLIGVKFHWVDFELKFV